MFLSPCLWASNEQQITEDFLGYQVYVVQNTNKRMCKILKGKWRFEGLEKLSSAEREKVKIERTYKLASKIVTIAEAFEYSSRFDIGYWMGILQKESLFCESVCGGTENGRDRYCAGNYSEAKPLYYNSKSGPKPYYVDLGIGQINYETALFYLNKVLTNERHTNAFQKLIDQRFFKDFHSIQEIKDFFSKNKLSSSQSVAEKNALVLKIFNRLRNDENLNLALSLGIFIKKIEESEMRNKIWGENGNTWQQKLATKKNSAMANLRKDYSTVWKRTFGAVSYNAAPKSYEYGMDVFCIKNFYDGLFMRTEKDTLSRIKYQKNAPFHSFQNAEPTQCLRLVRQVFQSYDNMVDFVAVNEHVDLRKYRELLDQYTDFDIYQTFEHWKKWEKNIINPSSTIAFNEFSASSPYKIVEVEGRLFEKNYYENSYLKDPPEGELYMYSFMRKYLYPYGFSKETYDRLVENFLVLNQCNESYESVCENLIPGDLKFNWISLKPLVN